MKSTLSLQQFKFLFFVPSLLAVFLAATNKVSAIDIKDTNYSLPSGAYYVSPDGKESNSGKSPDSPWPVEKALKSAPSEATIVFRGGTYRNIKSHINKKLTLQAYPHEKPWLKGSVVVTDWNNEGGKWRKNGWHPSFPRDVGKVYIDPMYPLAGHRDMVYINGVALKQVANKNQVGPGTFYVDTANKQLYIGDNPEGKMVEATALPEAFGIWKGASSTVVRGLGFAHYADLGIKIGAPHVTVENNTFVWNGVQGIYVLARDAVVRGNTFSYNGRKGLGGRGADNMLLEDNEIVHNNVERFSDWDASGIKVGASDNVVWRRNRVENNLAMGLWVDDSSQNAKIVNNISRNNKGIGIYFEISHGAIIAGNVVDNNTTSGVHLLNASNAHIYNNTLVDNHANLIIEDSKRNNTNRKEIAAGVKWIARDNVVKNNIFSDTTGGPLMYAPNCKTKQASKLMISSADHNAYYRESSSKPKTVIQWSLGGGKCGVGYRSLDAFKSATGLEANGLAIDNVAQNPFFVNAASRDYRLKSDSPAIGRSAPLPENIAQAMGLPSGVQLDLGAVQSKVVLSQ